MKKAFYLSILIISLSSCKDKMIWCEDIGDKIKPWSVYELGDSISMHDQFGNAALFKISKYHNQPAYEIKERGGLMKKMADCKCFFSVSNETNYFRLDVESSSSEMGTKRKPNQFTFDLTLGDLRSSFGVTKKNEVTTIHPNDAYSTIEYEYTSGNTVYSEALVFAKDTLQDSSSVYRYVYAKDKGLVEFSTRNPARTYILD